MRALEHAKEYPRMTTARRGDMSDASRMYARKLPRRRRRRPRQRRRRRPRRRQTRGVSRGAEKSFQVRKKFVRDTSRGLSYYRQPLPSSTSVYIECSTSQIRSHTGSRLSPSPCCPPLPAQSPHFVTCFAVPGCRPQTKPHAYHKPQGQEPRNRPCASTLTIPAPKDLPCAHSCGSCKPFECLANHVPPKDRGPRHLLARSLALWHLRKGCHSRASDATHTLCQAAAAAARAVQTCFCFTCPGAIATTPRPPGDQMDSYRRRGRGGTPGRM